MGFMMTSGMVDSYPTPERICACISLYVMGVILMMAADVQKYVRLQLK